MQAWVYNAQEGPELQRKFDTYVQKKRSVRAQKESRTRITNLEFQARASGEMLSVEIFFLGLYMSDRNMFCFAFRSQRPIQNKDEQNTACVYKPGQAWLV